MNVSQIVKSKGKVTIYFSTCLSTGHSHGWGGKEFDFSDEEGRQEYIDKNAEWERKLQESYK